MAYDKDTTSQQGPRKTPPPSPLAESKPSPKPALTDDQAAKYTELLDLVRSTLSEVPCPNEPSKAGPLTDSERAWLTRECLLRYLRATRWVVADASKRLLATLTWRREYGLGEFTPDYISPEQETGKQIIAGFDREGRPCQYLNPFRQNTDASPRQINHLFYMVERVVEMMPPGVEQLCLLINFKTTAKRKNTSVPVATAREVLSILQNHYPERLGKALIINVPWVVWGFFKIITPFIDPITREKLKFNEDMKAYVPPAQLWSEDWGGEMDLEYDHDVYWPALNDMCQKRREERMKRWVAGGKLVGESEVYLGGGDETSIEGVKYDEGKVIEAQEEENGVTAVEEKLAETKLEDAKGDETKKVETKTAEVV